MRTVTTEQTLYTYAELSETAKENARQQWSHFLWEDGSAQESMELLAEAMIADAGLEYEPGSLTYSDIYSQGGEPSFAATGTVDLGEGVGERELALTVQHHGGSRSSIDIEVTATEAEEEAEDWTSLAAAERAAKDFTSTLVNKIFWAMRAEDEYQSSDEQVAEAAESNGYEYDEDGNLA